MACHREHLSNTQSIKWIDIFKMARSVLLQPNNVPKLQASVFLENIRGKFRLMLRVYIDLGNISIYNMQVQ